MYKLLSPMGSISREYEVLRIADGAVLSVTNPEYVAWRLTHTPEPADLPPIDSTVDYKAQILSQAADLRSVGDRIGALELEITLVPGWPLLP